MVANGLPGVPPVTCAAAFVAPFLSWQWRHWLIMVAAANGSIALLERLRLNRSYFVVVPALV